MREMVARVVKLVKHATLKMSWPQGLAGSSPALGTKKARAGGHAFEAAVMYCLHWVEIDGVP